MKPTTVLNGLALGVAAFLTGCASTPIPASVPVKAPNRTGTPPAYSGKYYLDDGPMRGITREQVDAIPEPIPKREPLRPSNMRPYTKMGQTFTPMTELAPYREQGIGSWYGTKYHGQQTASGEPYDMLKLTAAHPTLPIPSYARVTNLNNGKSIIVRVNDRGPFLRERVIDVSFAAAMRLDYANGGSAPVEVELVLP